MLRDPGSFADNCHVKIDDAPTQPGHEIASVLEEDSGGRAFPLHIGRREVHADIAFADCAQNSVGQRMQRHIRI